jgi:hypothetical protein
MKRILASLLVVVLGSSSAVAHTRTVLDKDDSPGPLDLVAARVGHVHRQLRLHIRTYEPWADRSLEGAKNLIRFDFNLDSDPRLERCVVVKFDPPPEGSEGPTAILGGVYRNNCSQQISDHPGNVFRREPNELTLTLAPKLIGKSFRWRAFTSFEEDEHPDCPPHTSGPEPLYGSCTDYTRWDRHRS